MKFGTKIYPIFLPHAGCPFQCVYCNQRRVVRSALRGSLPQDVVQHCRAELSILTQVKRDEEAPMEVAFYGGTFTALPHWALHEILSWVEPLVKSGTLTGVRFSTRPDCITAEICSLLERYPVQVVELGVQSLDDQVLAMSRRGYDSEAVERAAALVLSRGWILGIQLMVGLPGDRSEKFLRSVKGAVSLGADLIRFYPTLVLEGTTLARWYREGFYRPLELEEAVRWCVPAYEHLVRLGRPPIRMGLQSDLELEKPGAVLAGPHHPSFGYLVRVGYWRNRVDEALSGHPLASTATRLNVRVPSRVISEVVGPHRSNLLHWSRRWSIERVTVSGDGPREGMALELEWGHDHP